MGKVFNLYTRSRNNEINKDNSKILLVVNMFLFLILILLFLLRKHVNADFACLAIVGFMFISLLKSKSEIFIKYFFSIFYIAFMLSGVWICNDYDIYLHEIAQYSGYNGSFSITCIYCSIFLFGLVAFDSFFASKMRYFLPKSRLKFNSNINKCIYKCFFVLGWFIFLCVVKKPSFMLGVDRFEYAAKYLPGWLAKLESMVIYLTPLLMFPMVYENKITNKIIFPENFIA